MITRELAWEKLNDLIKNQNLVKHCLAVEAAMLGYADYYDIDETEKSKWRIAGLVHDADWEKYPDVHPAKVVEWLKQNGVDDDLVNAVEAHGWEFGIEAKSLMAKTLRAVDELTGLIVAVALVKDRKLENVSVDSVMKKWNKKDFARGAKREDIERGAKDLDIPLEKHVEIVLEAMKKKSDVLGL